MDWVADTEDAEAAEAAEEVAKAKSVAAEDVAKAEAEAEETWAREIEVRIASVAVTDESSVMRGRGGEVSA